MGLSRSLLPLISKKRALLLFVTGIILLCAVLDNVQIHLPPHPTSHPSPPPPFVLLRKPESP